MGTVGLNFGLAASGQGFDVASTVNQIVVNLQQDAGSFGSSFATTLENLGNDSGSDGAISLALKEGSSQETSLKDEISAQDALIATQKANLSAELKTANEIPQSIP